MAVLTPEEYEEKYNDPTSGLFKANGTKAINAARVQTLVTDTKDSFKNRMRGTYDLATETYPASGGNGSGGIPETNDFWYGINEGDFTVHGFEGPVTLFRGAILIYIGGDVSDPISWIVKQ